MTFKDFLSCIKWRKGQFLNVDIGKRVWKTYTKKTVEDIPKSLLSKELKFIWFVGNSITISLDLWR